MSFVKVMIHSVWGTKNRARILLSEKRTILFSHIITNAKEKNIFINTINGEPDHVHCLFSLNADMALPKAMNLIKGEASFWANNENLIASRLEWADDYFAVSVSESQLSKVRAYIRNQQEHHRKISFEEEYKKFIQAYGIKNQG